MSGRKKKKEKSKKMVPTRVELATLALLAPRSNRLSYRTDLVNVASQLCFISSGGRNRSVSVRVTSRIENRSIMHRRSEADERCSSDIDRTPLAICTMDDTVRAEGSRRIAEQACHECRRRKSKVSRESLLFSITMRVLIMY